MLSLTAHRPFHLGEVSSGEPQLYLGRDLAADHVDRNWQPDHARRSTRSMIPSAGAAVVMLVMSVGVVAQERLAPECAARDLQAVTWIEAHGLAGDMPSAELSAASFRLLDARAACDAGRLPEAFALYGSIIGTVTHATQKR